MPTKEPREVRGKKRHFGRHRYDIRVKESGGSGNFSWDAVRYECRCGKVRP